MTIRPAASPDAEAVARIYNDGIEDRLATFETRLRTSGDFRGWFAGELPFLVTERDGEVVGFARVSPYSDRCAYEGVGEHAVYVARSARGEGVDCVLVERLIGEAAE